MGQFGEESAAHAGLSGYDMADGWDYALERLHERMGIAGPYVDREGRTTPMFLTVFEGAYAGRGPEGEDLFAPSAIVFSIRTDRMADYEAMRRMVINRLRRRGYVEG